VTPDGIISTIAGNGMAGYSGDGGPALDASLNYPKGLALDPEGNLYIADCFNGRIRMVDALGIISTIAGVGTMGYRGDGGPAAAAQFRFPSWIARTASGNIYVSDTQNNRVRLLVPQPADPNRLPSISNAGVLTSTAFGGFPAIAPGAWIEIYGSNLAGGTRAWTGADFRSTRAPIALDGTQVLIGGLPAYVAFISPNQVNALVPFHAGLGRQQVRVLTNLGTSAPYEVDMDPVRPGLLAPPSFLIGDRQYAAAVFADGATYALPAGAIPGVASRPARAGETITFYGAGFGPVNPFLEAGAIVQRSNTLELPARISIGDMPATVTYQGLAPGGIGLYQFNVTVPRVPAGDAVPVSFTQSGVTGRQTLYIAVVD
jgi:uncharacterized protein (TIGR03437 family)